MSDDIPPIEPKFGVGVGPKPGHDMPPTIHDPGFPTFPEASQFVPEEPSGPPAPVQPEYMVSYDAGQRPPPLLDPDHFAVAEEDYATDNVLDRLYRWIAARVGAATEVEDIDDQVLAERTRRWTSRTIAFATLTLLFLNAQSIRSWASTLEPSWATETLRLVADDWADRLKAVGLDQPRETIHTTYEAQKARTWDGGGQKPAAPGPPS